MASNFGGTGHSGDMSFTTPDVPQVGGTEVSGVGGTTAHIVAQVVANASPTEVHFEYGPGAGYNGSTGSTAIGAGLFASPVESTLTGLVPGTTYHARAVATNAIGTTFGAEQTFTTAPAPVPVPVEEAKPCKKSFVKKHGKCVKRKPKKQHKKHHTRHHHG